MAWPQQPPLHSRPRRASRWSGDEALGWCTLFCVALVACWCVLAILT
jgi:hypothetical protein